MKALAIKDFPDYYITDRGDVYSRNYSRTGCIKKLTPYKNHKGYLWLHLGRNKTCYIHRLVAETFIPNPENKSQINHKDGNKENNCVNNLEWTSNSENVLHAYRILHRTNNFLGKSYMKGRYGKDNPTHKVVQQIKDGEVIAEFYGICEAGRVLGLNHANIVSCCQGKRKTVGGFNWKYKK